MEKITECMGHTSRCNCAAFASGQSDAFATGSDDCVVHLWRIGSAVDTQRLPEIKSAITGLVFSDNNKYVAAGTRGGSVKIFDLKKGKVVRTLRGHRASSSALDFHPYGSFMVTGSDDHKMKIWDIREKTCINTYSGHADVVRSVRSSPDGQWVASGSADNSVKLWDLVAGKLMSDLNGHKGSVHSLQFHPSKFVLASGSADRSVRCWNLDTFRAQSTVTNGPDAVERVEFTADGDRLLVGTDQTVKMWAWNQPVPACEWSGRGSWQKMRAMRWTSECGVRSDDDGSIDPTTSFFVCGSTRSFISIWKSSSRRDDTRFDAGTKICTEVRASEICSGDENIEDVVDVTIATTSKRDDHPDRYGEEVSKMSMRSECVKEKGEKRDIADPDNDETLSAAASKVTNAASAPAPNRGFDPLAETLRSSDAPTIIAGGEPPSPSEIGSNVLVEPTGVCASRISGTPAATSDHPRLQSKRAPTISPEKDYTRRWIPHRRDQTFGLRVESFMSANFGAQNRNAQEQRAVKKILFRADRHLGCLTRRLDQVRRVRQAWIGTKAASPCQRWETTKRALSDVKDADDKMHARCVLLRHVDLRSALCVDLKSSTNVLDIVGSLLRHPASHDEYRIVALHTFLCLLDLFGELVVETLSESAKSGLAVRSVAFHERREKCESFVQAGLPLLESIRASANSKKERSLVSRLSKSALSQARRVLLLQHPK